VSIENYWHRDDLPGRIARRSSQFQRQQHRQARKLHQQYQTEAKRRTQMGDLNAKVFIFACRYCAYSAADLAGSERRSYPTATTIVLVPCSGRIDESLLLKAFENGADGVMVMGCLEGNCHFISGNLGARGRVQRVRNILETINFGADRIRMFNLSAGEGARFAVFVNDFVSEIQELGLSPVNVTRILKGTGIPAESNENISAILPPIGWQNTPGCQ
jgi:F420-non-reducing hydrogenase iron-sulfur subunit